MPAEIGSTAAARGVLARRLSRQAHHCEQLGSPLYAALLRHAAADLDTEGAVWRLLEGFEHEDEHAALALRLMGAVHRLVLTGDLPDVAAYYPSVGGDGDTEAIWPAFEAALVERRAAIRAGLAHGCQTNEVGRSAALLGGFLEAAHRTGLSLRILEIGASAGLNLRWDRYRYESNGGGWGDPGSPLRFESVFDVTPPLYRRAEVAERKGCDLEPVDPTSPDGSLTLRSFIWANQMERFHRLEAAIEVARRVPAPVERMDAATFLERELASPSRGVTTVVYHSVVMHYIDPAGRARIAGAIDSAAHQATASAPVAWLRMEPNGKVFEVRMTLWPGGDDELVAVAHAHGTRVRWLVSSGTQ